MLRRLTTSLARLTLYKALRDNVPGISDAHNTRGELFSAQLYRDLTGAVLPGGWRKLALTIREAEVIYRVIIWSGFAKREPGTPELCKTDQGLQNLENPRRPRAGLGGKSAWPHRN